jgi:hypothetical protein
MANERYAEFYEQNPHHFVQSLFEESSTQLHRLGTVRRLNDGREFIYVKVGSANLAAGVLVQGAVAEANHANCALANVADAVASGTRQVTITLGSTAVSANDYAEGFLNIEDGTAGAGHIYKIKNHPAANAGANLTLTLYDKLRANLTSAHGTLIKHPCKDVIIHPSPPTEALVGVTVRAMTANYYGWVQKKGPVSVLVNGTIVAGDCVIASGTVDGAVMASANGQETERQVGMCIHAGANTEYGVVDLGL